MTTGLNATYSAQTVVTGNGFGAGGTPPFEDTAQTTPPSTNAPLPQSYGLAANAVTTLLMPGTQYAFSRVQLMPMPQAGQPSSNVKNVACGIAPLGPWYFGPNWTAGSVTLPATPGSSLNFYSAGAEVLMAVFS